MFCTSSTFQCPDDITRMWELRAAWMLDDLWSCMYWMRDLSIPESQALNMKNGGGNCEVRRSREIRPYALRQALMHVQGRIQGMSLIGFLRDDGTATTKARTEAHDVLTCYKLFLINMFDLKCRRIEFEPSLLKFEDIALSAAILAKGGKTMKVMKWAYRATHSKRGGCELQRNKSSTELSDIMAPNTFADLPMNRKAIVQNILERVRARERKSGVSGQTKLACGVTDPDSLSPSSPNTSSSSSSDSALL